MFNIIYQMILNIGLLIIFAYCLCQLKIVKDVFLYNRESMRNKIAMMVIFGVMGIISTYTGVKVGGAIANTRVISVIVGGIIGGPAVGLGAGVIAGVHRFAIDINGFTGVACCVSTIIEGIIGGILHNKFNTPHKKRLAFVLTIFAEILQMGIILLIARPYSEAIKLVEVIAFPMILFNSIGVVILLGVFNSFFSHQVDLALNYVKSILEVLDNCIPFIRKGVNDKTSMHKVCQNLVELPWIGWAKLTDLKNEVIAVVGNQSYELSTIEVPLKFQNEDIAKMIIGTSSMVLSKDAITTLQQSIGSFVATQFEYNRLDAMIQDMQTAQMDQLQSQINPHFFFNSLSTAASLCRIDSEKARRLLIQLGDYFRKTLEKDEIFVNFIEEAECLELYLELEKMRFEEKLEYELNLPHLQFPIMSFILQPLVQACIKSSALSSGKIAKVSCTVDYCDHILKITAITNGEKTMKDDEEIKLLRRRLKTYYGQNAIFENTDNTYTITIKEVHYANIDR